MLVVAVLGILVVTKLDFILKSFGCFVEILAVPASFLFGKLTAIVARHHSAKYACSYAKYACRPT